MKELKTNNYTTINYPKGVRQILAFDAPPLFLYLNIKTMKQRKLITEETFFKNPMHQTVEEWQELYRLHGKEIEENRRKNLEYLAWRDKVVNGHHSFRTIYSQNTFPEINNTKFKKISSKDAIKASFIGFIVSNYRKAKVVLMNTFGCR